MLANGLRVNLKARKTGTQLLPCDARGEVVLEVVSLGGRATQPPHLKGACELLNLNVPSGFRVAYWPSPEPFDEKLATSRNQSRTPPETLMEWIEQESLAETLVEEVLLSFILEEREQKEVCPIACILALTINKWLPICKYFLDSVLDQVYFDAHMVNYYFGENKASQLICDKEHLLLRKTLHSKCINYPKVALFLLLCLIHGYQILSQPF